jgi:hypothetical protein
MHGQACDPLCNAGFELKNQTRCSLGYLTQAECVEINQCRAIKSFIIDRSEKADESGLVGANFSALVELSGERGNSLKTALVLKHFSDGGRASYPMKQAPADAFMRALGQLRDATSMYAVVSIMNQTCDALHSAEFTQSCKESYEQSGKACVRQPNASLCSLPSALVRPSVHTLSGLIVINSSVAVFTTRPIEGCKLSLVPVKVRLEASFGKGPTGRPNRLQLSSPNRRYLLSVTCGSNRSCSYPHLQSVVLRCPPNSLVVDGRCVACGSIASVLTDGVCKRLPALSVQLLSDTVQVVVRKTRNSSSHEAGFTLQLEGGFDVHWTLDCSVAWLDCDRSGELYGSNALQGTVAKGMNSSVMVSVVANSSGFVDNFGTLVTEMAEALIVLRAHVQTQGRELLSGAEKGRLDALLPSEVAVRMKVDSEFYLTVDVLELRTAGASRKVLPDSQPMDFTLGDPILLRVYLVDVDGLRVYRSSEILEAVSYDQYKEYRPVTLRRSEFQDDMHEVWLPSDWFPSSGTYNIRIRRNTNTSSDGPQTIAFALIFRSALRNYFIFAGVVAAILLPLLAILAVLVWRTPDRAKGTLKSYLEFELQLWAESSMEVFDTLTDTLSCLSIVKDDEAEWLRFGYLAGYGVALVSSVLTLVLMWKFLAQKLQTRFRRCCHCSPNQLVLTHAHA